MASHFTVGLLVLGSQRDEEEGRGRRRGLAKPALTWLRAVNFLKMLQRSCEAAAAPMRAGLLPLGDEADRIKTHHNTAVTSPSQHAGSTLCPETSLQTSGGTGVYRGDGRLPRRDFLGRQRRHGRPTGSVPCFV
ncbi:hypothetical protein EYF80_045644 [Liparis tanakae]|uniref:Uncharacterized protein n=1 Tax=Liparis tanakae TaxID=230148 RepID=A0A4Z2FTV8_9TELE|nr:hypothetical protein EYF80_045644 [Liparis tanakae]